MEKVKKLVAEKEKKEVEECTFAPNVGRKKQSTMKINPDG